MTFEFQEIVNVPNLDNPPFAALGVCADNGKILSVDYLPYGLEVTKTPVSDMQTKKVVCGLAERLDAFLKDPESVDFDGVPLCYSAMRNKYCKVRLDTKYHRKMLETLGKPDTVCCGEVRSYKEISDAVGWSNKEVAEIEKAVTEAPFREKVECPLAKAVGDMCPANPFGVVVPCFRVVYSGHYLGELGCNPYLEAKFGKKRRGWEIARRIKCWLIEREGKYKVIPSSRSKLRPIKFGN